MTAHADPATCTRGFNGTRCPACTAAVRGHDETGHIDPPDEIWVRIGDGPWVRATHVEFGERPV